MGEIYQGRYLAGMIAGMKLTELIDQGIIDQSEALIGYVGAYPYPEVISGYTAFFLGARSECPSVRMKVRYTNKWSNYMLEKEVAGKLIEEGCVVISQHSDTIGPAVMCENADAGHPVFHVGYNQDMTDVAPTTSLIVTRIDWSVYMSAAVGAVLEAAKIEDVVEGNVHGNDVGGGLEEGWVKMLQANPAIVPQGSKKQIKKTISKIKKGRIQVFKGDFIGVDPQDPTDTWDLNEAYPENARASAPSFHYILEDVITVEDD